MLTFRIRHVALAAVLLGGAGQSCGVYAQKYTPPPPPLDAPCKPTKKDPCTPAPVSPAAPAKSTMAFPFPGDTSAAVSLDPNANPEEGTPKQDPKQAAPAGSDSKFPFPGDTPDGAPPASGSSSSGSSGSSTSSSGAPSADTADDDDPPAPTPANRRHLPKVEDLDAREAKDIEVSGFYYSTGNFLGAYSRGKDAVRLMPNDPEAHFALAQAASQLKKEDEAREEYRLSLKLDIAEDHAKVARLELARLK